STGAGSPGCASGSGTGTIACANPSTRPAAGAPSPLPDTGRRPGSGGNTGAGPSTSGAEVSTVTGRGGSVAHCPTGRRTGVAGSADTAAAPGTEVVPLRRNGQRIRFPLLPLSGSVLRAEPRVDLADLGDHPFPHRVLEIQDLVEVPVQVVGHVRDFLPHPVSPVRHDPP